MTRRIPGREPQNLRNVLTKFLDDPIEWGGKPVSDEEKLVILDGLKQRITEPLAGIAEERLRIHDYWNGVHSRMKR